MGAKRKSGILCHPTMLPSRYGIGDIGNSALTFLDFLKKGNIKMWQILPLSPISFGNSPYQSFSAFAYNHYLIDIDGLVIDGYLKEDDIEEKEFDTVKVDYENVIAYKESLLQKAYQAFKETYSKDYLRFCDENSFWLNDYALYRSIKSYYIKKREDDKKCNIYEEIKKRYKKILKEEVLDSLYYGGVWVTWDDSIKNRKKDAMREFEQLLIEDILYHKFVQYIFYKQWKKVVAYADELGIEIVGDIPIFVSYDSSDVWADRTLFILDSYGFPKEVAGVPPDYFSPTGQLWGNPLYAYKAHAKTDFEWWKKRFNHIFKQCHIVRIDHFRGFESYWSVRFGEETAENGKWVKAPGDRLFAELKKEFKGITERVIAEDLGIISDDVRDFRRKTGFPGMKVLQFAFDTENDNTYLPHNFKDSHCVLYTGTHDNNTTLGFYEKAPEKVRDYIRRYINVSGEDIAWDFIRLAFMSTANIVIVPIQDVLSLGEEFRMNVPGTIEDNWEPRLSEGYNKDVIAEGLKYLCELYNR